MRRRQWAEGQEAENRGGVVHPSSFTHQTPGGGGGGRLASMLQPATVLRMDRALLARATSSDDKPTPGYMYGEIAK